MAALDGNPTGTPYYPGQERHSDGAFATLDAWTPSVALAVAGADVVQTRAGQVARLRDAIDDDRLPEEAVDVLIAAGWTELEQAG